MHSLIKTIRAAVLIAAAMSIVWVAAPRAQQPPAPAPKPATPAQPAPAAPAAPPPAPAKPLIPVATNTIAANPDAYYGQPVTISAAVEQILSRSAFAIDQRRVAGAPPPKNGPTDVLVLVPTIQSPVEANAYVTVIGELVKFDPAEVARKAKDYKLDLPADAIAKYTGRPALIATSVINEKFVDLAKRLPPPLNAEEEAYQKMMKQVGPAFAALRTGIDGSNAETAAKNAAVLKQAFTETEAFWKPKKAEPTQLAHDARLKVESIQAAVTAGKWDEAKASVGTLGQACASCHGAYRERFDDGSFRIKMGSSSK
jgi:cytochrome c556